MLPNLPLATASSSYLLKRRALYSRFVPNKVVIFGPAGPSGFSPGARESQSPRIGNQNFGLIRLADGCHHPAHLLPVPRS